MHRLKFTVAVVVAAAALLASCHGQKPDDSPSAERGDDRLVEMASHISQRADAVFVIENVGQLVEALEAIRAFEPLDTDASPEAVGHILSGSIGFDPRDLRDWRSKGIRTDAPLIIAYSGDDPVVFLPVADPDVFEGFVSDQPWAYGSVGRAGHGFHPSSRPTDERASQKTPVWRQRDGVACLSLDRRRRDLDELCIQPDDLAAPSLATLDEFRAFRNGPMRDAQFGFFVPTYNVVTANELIPEFEREDIISITAFMRALAEIEGMSLTGSIDSGSVLVRARLGLTERAHRSFAELFDVGTNVGLDRRLAPDTVAAARLSIDPETGWTWMKTAMHWEARAAFREALSHVEEKIGRPFDFGDEIVDQLGGEVVVFVEPVPSKPSSAGQPKTYRARPHQRQALVEKGLAYSILVSFEDPVAPPKLLDVLESLGRTSGSGGASRVTVTSRPDTQTRVAEFKSASMPRLLVSGRQVLIAPTVLPIEHAEKTLRGEHLPVESTGAGQFARSAGPLAAFVDFQAFFDAVGRESAEKNLGEVASLLRFASGDTTLTDDSLTGNAEIVDASAIRFVTAQIIDSRVRSWSTQPKYQLRRSARQAAQYFGTFQRGCRDTSTCSEPWHADESGTPRQDERVFPGGLNQRLTTHRSPPTGGRHVNVDLEARQFPGKTAALLRLEWLGDTAFQYVYETNGTAGTGASFTITAVADLDPTTPEKHTMTISGEALESGRVEISDVQEKHRYE
jgi:hypothetical protein